MLAHLSLSCSSSSKSFLFIPQHKHKHYSLKSKHKTTRTSLNLTAAHNNNNNENAKAEEVEKEMRTLYPGGYKRAEIKLPNIVLKLDADELHNWTLDIIDVAVAKFVGIVVLYAGQATGCNFYEAACLLKSIIGDRAFFLLADRVDFAAAVNASGVLLSDQGLPPIVARNTLLSSKSDSVVLPVVGRIVQSVDSALNASSAEGADFLIYSALAEEHVDSFLTSINNNVKIPVFIDIELITNGRSFGEVSKVLASGARGVVISMDKLKSLGDGLSKILYDPTFTSKRSQEVVLMNELNKINTTNGFPVGKGMPSFVNVEEREMQFIRKERRLLIEAVEIIEKAAPLMEEISLLNDATAQLDEPFLLVIVGEFNSGKSSVINALLGGKFLSEGVVPTTNEITFLRYADLDAKDHQRCERLPDGQYICYLPAEILKKMVIVDTPGTNVILQRQQRLTEEFVPRADLLIFVLSADRPLSESEIMAENVVNSD